MRRLVVLCLVGALLATVPAGAALGDASNKAPGFESDSQSDGGLQLTGDLGIPLDILEVGSTETDAHTNKDDPSDASATATPIAILGVAPVQAECESTGSESEGAVKQSDSTELATIPVGEVAAVTLLPAACDTRAVKTNNSQGTAETAVVTAEALPDEAQLTAQVFPSSSESQTTSGQSHSDSSSSVLEVGLMGEEVSLITCDSSSFQNNGQETTQTEESLTIVNGVEAPVAEPFCSSGATYERTPPAK